MRLELAAGELVHATAIAWNGKDAAALEDALPVLHILRDINDYRSRTAGAGDLERRTDGGLETGRVGDQENVLGDRAHDRGDRGFLEGVGADGRACDLPANHDDRHRIGHANRAPA